jgi:acyl carrier protein
MLIDSQVLTTIEEEISSLLAYSMDDEVSVAPDDNLYDLGLNSLTLARLIVALEMAFGVDPFAEQHVIADIRTVGDLASVYTQSRSQGASSQTAGTRST